MNRDDYELLLRVAAGEPLPSPERDGDLTQFGRALVEQYRRANGHADDATLTLVLQQLLPPDDVDAALRALIAHEPPAAAESASAKFRALSLAELRTRPRPTYLVDRFLQADTVAMLEGVDGTYKTFLALAWAHCVALGMPWLGREVQQGRVLYLLGEGTRGLPQRADAWQIVNLKQRHDLVDMVGFVVDEMPQLWKGDAQHVLAANPGPYSLIVVDTLARAMVGGNENLQQDMGQLIDGCDQLRRGYNGACVLILHHLNQHGGSRGSTALPGALNTRLRLKREGVAPIVTLSVEKQKDDETERALTLVARKVELGGLDERGRPLTSLVLEMASSDQQPRSAPIKLKPTSIEALDTLRGLGPALFAQWRDATALAKTTFYHARKELLDNGLVEQIEDQYSLTEFGRTQGPRGSKTGSMDLVDPGIEVGPENGSGGGPIYGPPDPPDPLPRNGVRNKVISPDIPDPNIRSSTGENDLPWQ